MIDKPFNQRAPVPDALLKAMRNSIFYRNDQDWIEDRPVARFIIVGHLNRGYRPYYSLWEKIHVKITPGWLGKLLGKKPCVVDRYRLRGFSFNEGSQEASPVDLYPAIRRYKHYDCLDGDILACDDYRKIAGGG